MGGGVKKICSITKEPKKANVKSVQLFTNQDASEYVVQMERMSRSPIGRQAKCENVL